MSILRLTRSKSNKTVLFVMNHMTFMTASDTPAAVQLILKSWGATGAARASTYLYRPCLQGLLKFHSVSRKMWVWVLLLSSLTFTATSQQELSE